MVTIFMWHLLLRILQGRWLILIRTHPKFRPQSQYQPQGRRAQNDNAVIITCGTYDPAGDLGRGFGRGRCPRGQGGGNWRFGPSWGIGTRPDMPKARGFGAGANKMSGVFMHPHRMMDTAGFDSTHMGRGFPRPTFPGMIPPFRNVNALEIFGAFRPIVDLNFGCICLYNQVPMKSSSAKQVLVEKITSA
ncbi:hypothetical protein ACET3Z_028001 [Daucus carota]